jgi:PAS domain S-box-containing protein
MRCAGGHRGVDSDINLAEYFRSNFLSVMTFDQLVRLLADHLGTGIVLTDTALDSPGPLIRYANPAFCQMAGYAAEEIVGHSPRMLQGKGTNALSVRTLERTLRNGKRFHGVLTNYRKSGEPYLCEIDVRPIFGRDATPDAYIAFEREVTRPRGRPREKGLSRFKPVNAADEMLEGLPGLAPFSPGVDVA